MNAMDTSLIDEGELVGSLRHLVFRVYNCNRWVKAGK
jgi:hypothetical protein